MAENKSTGEEITRQEGEGGDQYTTRKATGGGWEFYRMDNIEGYTQDQLNELNQRGAAAIQEAGVEWPVDLESFESYRDRDMIQDQVERICERVRDAYDAERLNLPTEWTARNPWSGSRYVVTVDDFYRRLEETGCWESFERSMARDEEFQRVMEETEIHSKWNLWLEFVLYDEAQANEVWHS